MLQDNVIIAERFRKVITLHIIKNMLPSADGRSPLMLGIHGPSGFGKTYQCEQMLKELKVMPFVISGGELESPDAGAPARLIRSVYLRASKCVTDGDAAAVAILINDIDTAIGDFGPLVQYTVNRQMVYVELMNRADYPRMVEGMKTHRIPIIFTGNDFTKLFAPLIRTGRMTAFEWKPSLDETVAIVSTIFPSLSPSEQRDLVLRYPNEPVASYSTLKSMLTDDRLYQLVCHETPQKVIDHLRKGQDIKFTTEISYSDVVSKADTLIRSGTFANHLRRGEK